MWGRAGAEPGLGPVDHEGSFPPEVGTTEGSEQEVTGPDLGCRRTSWVLGGPGLKAPRVAEGTFKGDGHGPVRGCCCPVRREAVGSGEVTGRPAGPAEGWMRAWQEPAPGPQVLT